MVDAWFRLGQHEATSAPAYSVRPMHEHKGAWSAAWGIVALLCGGGALTWYLTARSPNSGLPIWPAYVLGAIALASLYGVFATLSGWWPWREPPVQDVVRPVDEPVHDDAPPAPVRQVSSDEDRRLEQQQLGRQLLTELAANRERIRGAERERRGWTRNRSLRSTRYHEWSRSRATAESPANDALRRFYVWADTMNHRFADGEANEEVSIGQVMRGPGLDLEGTDSSGLDTGLSLLVQAEEALRTSLARPITHGDLKRNAIETSYRLIDESQHGEITGERLVQALGIDPNDRKAVMQLYHALFAAKEEGSLRCDFPGGMRLPNRIRRP